MMSKAFLLSCLLLFAAPIAWAQKAANETENLTNVAFKEIYAKDAVANLARTLSLNVTFEESLKNTKINFEVSDVTLSRCLEMVLIMRGWRAKQKDRETILVYADTDEARKRLANLPDWTHAVHEKR